MSQALLKVISPPATRVPRGAKWAAAGVVWLARALSLRGTAART